MEHLWFMVQGNLWFMVNDLLDGREEIKIRFMVQGSWFTVHDQWFMVHGS